MDEYEAAMQLDKAFEGFLQHHAEGSTPREAGAFWRDDLRKLDGFQAVALVGLLIRDQAEFVASDAMAQEDAMRQLVLMNEARGLKAAQSRVSYVLRAMQTPDNEMKA
jgi:hypothetical protein